MRTVTGGWLRRVLAVVIAGGAMAGASMLGGCSTNPATGETSLALMSWDWERSVALEAGPQFTEEYGGETPDTVAQAYVDEVGQKLTSAALEQAYASVPELDWSYTLLDSEVINAFALPGGKVYFSRGLAAKLENEAQLAGVLGHEVGHVMARHGNQRITKQVGFNVLLAGAAVAVGAAGDDSDAARAAGAALPALAVGGNVVLLSYGREEEMEADSLGMQYMSSVGYDPAAQRRVMEILQAESGGNAPPEWLSTHPASETRIRRINQLLEEKYSHTQGSAEHGVYAEAYKKRMLDRLRALPAPRHGATQARGERFDLSRPVTWCAHCASVELAAAN